MSDLYDDYWADLRAEEAIDRMREEEDERARWMPDGPDEPPPPVVGSCAALAADGQPCRSPVIEEERHHFVGFCEHWDPEEPRTPVEESLVEWRYRLWIQSGFDPEEAPSEEV